MNAGSSFFNESQENSAAQLAPVISAPQSGQPLAVVTWPLRRSSYMHTVVQMVKVHSHTDCQSATD